MIGVLCSLIGLPDHDRSNTRELEIIIGLPPDHDRSKTRGLEIMIGLSYLKYHLLFFYLLFPALSLSHTLNAFPHQISIFLHQISKISSIKPRISTLTSFLSRTLRIKSINFTFLSLIPIKFLKTLFFAHFISL